MTRPTTEPGASPGEWHVSPYRATAVVAAAGGRGLVFVADCLPRWAGTHVPPAAEAAANARLFAQARRMRDLLRRALATAGG